MSSRIFPDCRFHKLAFAAFASWAFAAAAVAAPPLRMSAAPPNATPPERTVFTLPLDEGWTPRGGAVLNVSPSNAKLSAKINGYPGALVHAAAFDASQYRVLILRMSADAGATFAVAWSGPLAGAALAPDAVNAIRIPLIADGVPHDYLFEMDAEGAAAWAGAIESVALFPSDASATVEIAEVSFVNEPSKNAPCIQFGTEAIESVDTAAPWRAAFAPGAMFEARFAAIGAEPVRFRVYPEGHPETPLADVAASPGAGWVRASAPLDAAADALVIEKQSPPNSAGFVGNPLVFSLDPDPEAVPVVLISCDTLRADRCSAYGYERETTPRLDAFAKESAAQFMCALTPAPNTLYAHACMLTGFYPRNIGVTETTRIPEEICTLPEMLRARGYLTAGFTGHYWWLRPRYGFAQGFDIYDTTLDMLRHVNETLPRALNWLDAHLVPRFFLFFHLYDVHQKADFQGYRLPYDPGVPGFRLFSKDMPDRMLFSTPERNAYAAAALLDAHREGRIALDEKDRLMIDALYDDCVRLVDDAVGRLLDNLKARGLFDRALIVVTADHGETLNERGYYGHLDIFDETLRVPLWVHFPGGAHAGERFDAPVALMDIFPTVMDVLGIEDGPDTDGISLKKQIENGALPRDILFIQNVGYCAARTQTFKLRYDNTAKWHTLYELGSDPGENNNCIESHLDKAAELSEAARQFFQAPVPENNDAKNAVSVPTENEKQQLEALGYLN